MKKPITFIVVAIFAVNSAGQGYLSPRMASASRDALRPTASAINQRQAILDAPEGNYLLDTPTVTFSRQSTQIAVMTGKIKRIKEIYDYFYKINPRIKNKLFKSCAKGIFLYSEIGEIAQILRIIAKNTKGKEFLEFGSGDGRVAILAALFGFHVTAVEFEVDAVDFSNRVLAAVIQEGLIQKGLVIFINGDAYNEDFSKYDVIFVTDGDGLNKDIFQKQVNTQMRKAAVILLNHPKYPFDSLEPLWRFNILHPFLFGPYEGKAMAYKPAITLDTLPKGALFNRQIDKNRVVLKNIGCAA